MSNIPEIAITPFESSLEDISANIAETLTDIEDLYDNVKLKPKKSKLKIKLVTDGATTDMEDVEASDEDDGIELTKHEKPISLKELDFDACSMEETSNKNDGNTIQNYNVNRLELTQNSLEGYLTDYENFSTDDDIPEVIPEAEIELEDYKSDCKISWKMQQNTPPASPSGQLTVPTAETHNLTDCETLGDEKGEDAGRKCRSRRRRSKVNRSLKRETKMKKSTSLPNHIIGDSDGEDTCRFALCLEVVKKSGGVTDTEELEDFKAPIRIVKRSKTIEIPKAFGGVQQEKQNYKEPQRKALVVSVDAKSLSEFFTGGHTCATDDELMEGELEEVEMPELVLPPPIRTLVVLSEKESLIPTTKILPLDETKVTPKDDCFDCETDIECLPFSDYGKTIHHIPEIEFDSDDLICHRAMGRLILPTVNLEPQTDTEELVVPPRSVKKRTVDRTLHRQGSVENLTDIEGFETDEDPSMDCKERSVTPYLVNELEGDIISSKDFEGILVTKNHLEINNIERKMFATSPTFTDTEDIYGSGEDEVFTRADTVTPSELRNQLDQAQFSKVHVGSGSKLNFDEPGEIMYLKGGGYVQGHTDVEDISGDEEVGAKSYVSINVKEGSACFEMVKEWDIAKKSAPKQETSVTKDAEQQGEEAGATSVTSHEVSPSLKAEEDVGAQHSTQPRQVADQHQLSDEMKQLLKELEKESKQ